MPRKVHNDVTAIILAGGQGRRMGSQQKALITLNEKPLIAHVIDRLESQVKEILISANSDMDTFREFGFPVISDRFSDQQGPLAGIASCMNCVKTRFVLVLPCDTPFLPRDLVTRMIDLNDTDINIAHDGKREQSLVMLFDRKLAPSLEVSLGNNQRKVGLWVHSHRPGIIDFSDEREAFFNINTPDDLTTARQEN